MVNFHLKDKLVLSNQNVTWFLMHVKVYTMSTIKIKNKAFYFAIHKKNSLIKQKSASYNNYYKSTTADMKIKSYVEIRGGQTYICIDTNGMDIIYYRFLALDIILALPRYQL